MKSFIFSLFIFSPLILFAQSDRIIKPIEGVLFYSNELVFDSVPQDVIFIPYNINEGCSVENNIEECLKSTNTGYFLFFNVMRHTQPFIYDFLNEIPFTVDTNKWTIKERLSKACFNMPKIALTSVNFPVLGSQIPSESDISVTAGKIIFRELNEKDIEIDAKVYESIGITPKKQKADASFCVKFKGREYKLVCIYNNAFLGQKMAFIPLKY
jgi:hypothetical protein